MSITANYRNRFQAVSGLAFVALVAGMALAVEGRLVGTPASAHEASGQHITVAHPWVRATPGGVTLTSAYLEIKSRAGSDRLIGGSAHGAERLEVHTHEKDGDVMRMRQVSGLEIDAGQSRVLRPSGDHLMLIGLKSPLKEGDLVKLKLQFEKAGIIEIDATVEPVGAMGPHGFDHQPGHPNQEAGDAKHNHSNHDASGQKSGHEHHAH